jgi:ribosomal protein S18 acetylase RimI-like enzyme
MALEFRLAGARDYDVIERMVVESFAPVSWARRTDERFGSLDGQDWRARWHSRMLRIFESQIVLTGRRKDDIVAMSSGTIDPECSLAYIDLLAVDRRFQARGYGREMLRAMMDYFRNLGAQYVYLDCLTDNEAGNTLYLQEGFTEIVRQVRWFRRLV